MVIAVFNKMIRWIFFIYQNDKKLAGQLLDNNE